MPDEIDRVIAGLTEAQRDEPPICADWDEDCPPLDHLHCWLYDPAKGRCPYLGTHSARLQEQGRG